MLSPRGIWKVTNLLAFWDGTVCVCVCVSLHMHMDVQKVCMQGCAGAHM